MSVVGELIETQIGLHDERVADLCRQRFGCDVEDPMRIIGTRAEGVAHLGDAEQHHAADPRLRSLDRGRTQRIERMLSDTGHRPDLHGLRDALSHEQREDELPRQQRGLAHQIAHCARLPQSSQSHVGEAHGANSSAACGRVKCETASIRASIV